MGRLKRIKISKKIRIIFGLLLLASIILTVFLYFKIDTLSRAGQKTHTTTLPVKQNIKPVKPKPGIPTRLTIPKINIDADIESVGLTSTGNMATPKKIQNSAWYQAGPRPGEIGSAVIDGHLDGLNNKPGVFINLKQLKIGDQIMTTDINGEITTFKVKEIKSFPANEHPAEVFQSSSGIHLNLITCNGPWNKSQKQFSKRLVIFSDLVD